jgi:hypothetical protein
VQADLEAGTLRSLRVMGLPPLFSDMGIVRLCDRSLSPMAKRAIELIVAVAAKVNSSPARTGAPSRRQKA